MCAHSIYDRTRRKLGCPSTMKQLLYVSLYRLRLKRGGNKIKKCNIFFVQGSFCVYNAIATTLSSVVLDQATQATTAVTTKFQIFNSKFMIQTFFYYGLEAEFLDWPWKRKYPAYLLLARDSFCEQIVLCMPISGYSLGICWFYSVFIFSFFIQVPLDWQTKLSLVIQFCY